MEETTELLCLDARLCASAECPARVLGALSGEQVGGAPGLRCGAAPTPRGGAVTLLHRTASSSRASPSLGIIGVLFSPFLLAETTFHRPSSRTFLHRLAVKVWSGDLLRIL